MLENGANKDWCLQLSGIQGKSMIRRSRILLVLVAVEFVIGILFFTAPLDQSAKNRLLVVGLVVLVLFLFSLLSWYRNER